MLPEVRLGGEVRRPRQARTQPAWILRAGSVAQREPQPIVQVRLLGRAVVAEPALGVQHLAGSEGRAERGRVRCAPGVEVGAQFTIGRANYKWSSIMEGSNSRPSVANMNACMLGDAYAGLANDQSLACAGKWQKLGAVGIGGSRPASPWASDSPSVLDSTDILGTTAASRLCPTVGLRFEVWRIKRASTRTMHQGLTSRSHALRTMRSARFVARVEIGAPNDRMRYGVEGARCSPVILKSPRACSSHSPVSFSAFSIVNSIGRSGPPVSRVAHPTPRMARRARRRSTRRR